MSHPPSAFPYGTNYGLGITPVSNRASIVSVDTILSDTHERFQAVSASESEASRIADTRIKGAMGSLIIEPSARGHATGGAVDASFTRHEKYFFKDGNVTFLVDGTLYCIHRYFFSRDSVYFSARFAQLDIREHEALSTIISLGDIEHKDFEAFLSVIYPQDFGKLNLSYEEWKSVLHLSTLWGFASIRKLAITSICPQTPHDRLLLARTYSIDDWVLPALTALCERKAPLSLDEARQMTIEDVVLVATVREDIRSNKIRVKGVEVLRRVEAARAGKLSSFEEVNEMNESDSEVSKEVLEEVAAEKAVPPCAGTCGESPPKTEAKAEVEAICDPANDFWGIPVSKKAKAKAKPSTKQPGSSWAFGP